MEPSAADLQSALVKLSSIFVCKEQMMSTPLTDNCQGANGRFSELPTLEICEENATGEPDGESVFIGPAHDEGEAKSPVFIEPELEAEQLSEQSQMELCEENLTERPESDGEFRGSVQGEGEINDADLSAAETKDELMFLRPDLDSEDNCVKASMNLREDNMNDLSEGVAVSGDPVLLDQEEVDSVIRGEDTGNGSAFIGLELDTEDPDVKPAMEVRGGHPDNEAEVRDSGETGGGLGSEPVDTANAVAGKVTAGIEMDIGIASERHLYGNKETENEHTRAEGETAQRHARFDDMREAHARDKVKTKDDQVKSEGDQVKSEDDHAPGDQSDGGSEHGDRETEEGYTCGGEETGEKPTRDDDKGQRPTRGEEMGERPTCGSERVEGRTGGDETEEGHTCSDDTVEGPTRGDEKGQGPACGDETGERRSRRDETGEGYTREDKKGDGITPIKRKLKDEPAEGVEDAQCGDGAYGVQERATVDQKVLASASKSHPCFINPHALSSCLANGFMNIPSGIHMQDNIVTVSRAYLYSLALRKNIFTGKRFANMFCDHLSSNGKRFTLDHRTHAYLSSTITHLFFRLRKNELDLRSLYKRYHRFSFVWEEDKTLGGDQRASEPSSAAGQASADHARRYNVLGRGPVGGSWSRAARGAGPVEAAAGGTGPAEAAGGSGTGSRPGEAVSLSSSESVRRPRRPRQPRQLWTPAVVPVKRRYKYKYPMLTPPPPLPPPPLPPPPPPQRLPVLPPRLKPAPCCQPGPPPPRRTYRPNPPSILRTMLDKLNVDPSRLQWRNGRWCLLGPLGPIAGALRPATAVGDRQGAAATTGAPTPPQGGATVTSNVNSNNVTLSIGVVPNCDDQGTGTVEPASLQGGRFGTLDTSRLPDPDGPDAGTASPALPVPTTSPRHDQGAGTAAPAAPRHDEGAGTAAPVSSRHDQGAGTAAPVPPRHDQGAGTAAPVSPRHDQGAGIAAPVPPRHDQGAGAASSTAATPDTPSWDTGLSLNIKTEPPDEHVDELTVEDPTMLDESYRSIKAERMSPPPERTIAQLKQERLSPKPGAAGEEAAAETAGENVCPICHFRTAQGRLTLHVKCLHPEAIRRGEYLVPEGEPRIETSLRCDYKDKRTGRLCCYETYNESNFIIHSWIHLPTPKTARFEADARKAAERDEPPPKVRKYSYKRHPKSRYPIKLIGDPLTLTYSSMADGGDGK